MSERVIKLLLIEDNIYDVKTFKLMLDSARTVFLFDIMIAPSLSESLALLDLHKFDVVLLDLSLPDESGIETLRKVFAHKKNIPVIVLTATDDELLGVEAVKMGAHNYLVKGQVTSKYLIRSICYAAKCRSVSEEIEKNLQKELELSDERFKHTYYYSPVMMFSFDSEGNICDVNQKWLEETGYPREEVIGKTLDFLIPRHHKKISSLEVIPQFLKVGYIKDYVCQYMKKDGSVIDVLINCVLSISPSGVNLGLAVVENISEQCKMEIEILDAHEKLEKRVRERTRELARANEELQKEINERKKIEEELKQAKDYAELIYRIAPSAIFTVDRNCSITSWNNMAAELTGYSAEEAVGKKCFVLCREKCCAFANAGNIEDLCSISRESVIITKDGILKTILKNRGLLKDSAGNVMGFIESFEDITEIKQTEDQLRKLSYAIEQSPASIIITNIQGDIEYVNPKFTKITGYTFEEVAGKNPRILKSGQVPLETYKQLWNTIISGYEWHGELHNKKKNGELYWEAVSISPIKNRSGMTTHFLGVKEDITDRKRAEFELQYAKTQADYANMAKSEFLANISHEIRTPLNGIIGFSEILFGTNLNDEQLDYVKTIKNSGMILLKLINDILDFSKIEAGKVEMEEADFDIEHIAYEVCEMISFIIISKPIEILCNIDDKVPNYLCGDALKLKQLFMNLMGNSSKFTEQGEISLNINLVEETAEQVKLHVSIKDTGIGIPEDKIGMIFDTFKQADGSITRKYGGSGLGLSICRKLIALMHGELWVESSLKNGSTFHFTLWMKKSLVVFDEDKIVPDRFKNKSILVVDDNALNVAIIEKILCHSGFRVIGVLDGSEAIEKLESAVESECFELVVLDIQMPGMNGYEVATKIRNSSREYVRNVPLLAFSTLFDKDIKKLIESGFNGFLPKPVRRQKTLETICKLLSDNFGSETHVQRAGEINAACACDEPAKVKYTLKVLLVEDHPVNQKLVKIIISGAGHDVDLAANGQEALDFFIKAHKYIPYDIVFMDIQMPVMDGITATKKIREYERHSFKIHHESIMMQVKAEQVFNRVENSKLLNGLHYRPTPIIAMTANVIKGDRESCIAAGMDDYIAKPIKKEIIFDMIKKWVLLSQ